MITELSNDFELGRSYYLVGTIPAVAYSEELWRDNFFFNSNLDNLLTVSFLPKYNILVETFFLGRDVGAVNYNLDDDESFTNSDGLSDEAFASKRRNAYRWNELMPESRFFETKVYYNAETLTINRVPGWNDDYWYKDEWCSLKRDGRIYEGYEYIYEGNDLIYRTWEDALEGHNNVLQRIFSRGRVRTQRGENFVHTIIGDMMTSQEKKNDYGRGRGGAVYNRIDVVDGVDVSIETGVPPIYNWVL